MKGLKIQNPRLILMMLPVLVELLATGIINNLNNVIFNKFSPNAVGDVDYPFFMVILGGLLNIGVSYYFGVYLSWGLPGIWIGYIADLAFRGIATVVRWNSGKWLKYVDRSSDL